jgi:hypothetical protein
VGDKGYAYVDMVGGHKRAAKTVSSFRHCRHLMRKPNGVCFCRRIYELHYRIILIIKPTRCTNFSNLFWNETLHVSDSSSVYHQEFFTVHTAMVYVVQFCRQLASRSICSCSQAVYKLVHLVGFIINIPHVALSHERKIWFYFRRTMAHCAA